ncbi:MAG: FtsW/RodA/SpoVE family cell cycle protein [Lachnospiraceae bacterium]|nr:FtsW/RodA/SpoVE family cell cycle protein [Lachnospiraceae bacterium]
MFRSLVKTIRNRLESYEYRKYNFRLIALVVALSVIGIQSIGSTSSAYAQKQTIGLVICVVLMLIASMINYNFFANIHFILYILILLMLAAVLVGGITVYNARRWFELGSFGTIQPSEFAKILYIIFISRFLSDRKDRINRLSTFVFYIILLALPVLLIYREPDLSTSLVFVFISVMVIFAAGLSYKVIISVVAVVVAAGVFLIWYIQQQGQKLFAEHQVQRVLTFLNPSEYMSTTYAQQYNSVMAIGSGMLNGKDLAGSASVAGANYLAAPQNDFIFAVVGEKYGFVGSCLVVILLLWVVIECLVIARNAKDMTGRLIAIGVASMIAFQTFVNVGVATAILPNTGLPLPFISYGLSSLLSSTIGIGLVINVGLQKTGGRRA